MRGRWSGRDGAGCWGEERVWGWGTEGFEVAWGMGGLGIRRRVWGRIRGEVMG